MCQKSLPTGQSLKKHVSSCHYQLSQAVAAHASSSASQQIKQESSTGETSYDCFPCQKAYKTQSGLAFHIKTKHQVWITLSLEWKVCSDIYRYLPRTPNTNASIAESLFRGRQMCRDISKPFTRWRNRFLANIAVKILDPLEAGICT